MSAQSTPIASEPDLFDLAATLAGCDPVDLVKVRRDPAGLVVILATGQKFTFDPNLLGANVSQLVRAQLAAVLGQPGPAPESIPTSALDKSPKAKRVR